MAAGLGALVVGAPGVVLGRALDHGEDALLMGRAGFGGIPGAGDRHGGYGARAVAHHDAEALEGIQLGLGVMVGVGDGEGGGGQLIANRGRLGACCGAVRCRCA